MFLPIQKILSSQIGLSLLLHPIGILIIKLFLNVITDVPVLRPYLREGLLQGCKDVVHHG